MKILHIVSFILLIVGGLNWGLVGLFEYDLVASLLGGSETILAKIIYILVGLSAILAVFNHKKDCVHCVGGRREPSMM